MKHSLLLAVLFLTSLVAYGEEPVSNTLHLKPGDVESVEILLEPDLTPLVRVYFTKEKLFETQTLVKANTKKPISIYMNDDLIVEPTIKETQVYNIRFLKLRFADFETAGQVARKFMPVK